MEFKMYEAIPFEAYAIWMSSILIHTPWWIVALVNCNKHTRRSFYANLFKYGLFQLGNMLNTDEFNSLRRVPKKKNNKWFLDLIPPSFDPSVWSSKCLIFYDKTFQYPIPFSNIPTEFQYSVLNFICASPVLRPKHTSAA